MEFGMEFGMELGMELGMSCGFLSGVGLVAVLLSCCAPAGWCCAAGLWDRLGLA